MAVLLGVQAHVSAELTLGDVEGRAVRGPGLQHPGTHWGAEPRAAPRGWGDSAAGVALGGVQMDMGSFPGGLAGKESTCNVGDPGSIPGSGRLPGEGIGYPLQYSRASQWLRW